MYLLAVTGIRLMVLVLSLTLQCLSCDTRKLQMTDAVKLYYISKINGKIEVKIGMQAQEKV